jgi:hypothetical protein
LDAERVELGSQALAATFLNLAAWIFRSRSLSTD